MPNDRAESAYRFRLEAAEKARHRYHPDHEANPDEARYGTACYPMSFTKGLEHDEKTGLVAETSDFEAFRTAIDDAFVEPFTTRVPVPRRDGTDRRLWEAPTAGVVFELQGSDPQAVTMPPAPELGSDELSFEMAEVYELALLRDEPFTSFEGAGSAAVNTSVGRLNSMAFATANFPGTRGRTSAFANALDAKTAFRGSSPGVEKGPYLSQFMLIGSAGNPADGFIGYGAQVIDQRVAQAATGDDHMVIWNDWLDVQRGFDTRTTRFGQNFLTNPDGTIKTRLICTPRDLASYVHLDALYQAYLNACLILLGHGAPFDPAFDLLSGRDGHEIMVNAAGPASVPVNAGGFALFGGPHILSLVTEVATRGLKAVRYQKFNVHLRLRPEALAARIVKAAEIEKKNPSLCGRLEATAQELDAVGILGAVLDHNQTVNAAADLALLPMAFEEGSPMHPTYGAGHATVAGACVTMLKAYFDTSAVFVRVVKKDNSESAHFWNKEQITEELEEHGSQVMAGAYRPICEEESDTHLEFVEYGQYALHGGHLAYHEKPDQPCPLTLEGELNKLCANISIGRNMAGVHYYSDYYDSARMGEEISIGILEEQALGYPTDKFVMSLATFDGQAVRIGRR
ncbi:MAG: bromoperoxidase [Pseudomonadota bacterium]